MSDAVPTRTRAALSPAFPLALSDGRRLALGPFTPRRVLMLTDIDSPLFGGGQRRGLASSWAATLRILADSDTVATALRIATDGPDAFVADAGAWLEESGISVDDLADAIAAIRAEWARVHELDRPDRPEEGASTAAGEACGPATDGSPNSSATAFTPGTGAPTKPSTAPSES